MIPLTRPNGTRVFVARDAVVAVWEPVASEGWVAGTQTVVRVGEEVLGVCEPLDDVLRMLP